MLNSIRASIYLVALLLVMVFVLWFTNTSMNRKVIERELAYTQVLQLKSRFAQLVIQEPPALLNQNTFARLLIKEQALGQTCSQCHPRKSDLLEQRTALLEKLHNRSMASFKQKQVTAGACNDLIRTLNAITIITPSSSSRHPLSPGNTGPIPDVTAFLEVTARLQQLQTNFVVELDRLEKSYEFAGFNEKIEKQKREIAKKIRQLYTLAPPRPGRPDLDTVLAKAAQFTDAFLKLVELKQENVHLQATLAANRSQISKTLESVISQVKAIRNQTRTRIELANRIVISLVTLLVILLFFRARTILRSIDTLIDETKKIHKDTSYTIVDPKPLMREFQPLISALNAMAAEITARMNSLKQEISNRIAAEEQISLAKKEWERTFDSVPDMIAIIDTNNRIVRANQAMAKQFDRPVKELIHTSCSLLMHGSPEPPKDCPHQALLRDGKDKHMELYDKNKEIYLDICLSPLFDNDDNLIGSVHVARNITDRKEAERERQEYALYLDSILQSTTSTAIAATDPDLRIKYFNPEAERIFNLSADFVMNRNILDLYTMLSTMGTGDSDTTITSPISTKMPVAHLELIMESIRQGSAQSFIIEIGLVILNARISAIHDQEGNFAGFLLIAHDITAQMMAEQQQKELTKRLQRSERMEAIGLMAGGVAHDLNNILSGVINYPELLLQQVGPNSNMVPTLEAIRDSGLRAAAVVADLLTVARGAATVKEVCDINELITEYLASAEFTEISGRYPKVRIDTRLDPMLATSRCSRIHIQKALMNLIINGMEAIEDQGQVTVTTSNYRISTENEDGVLPPGDYIALEVSDSGPGIPKHDLERIFEPFYSKKMMGRSGTGLGLTVVWNTVQDHEGRITVHSDHHGSRFRILLPATKEAVTRQSQSLSLDELQGSGSILVVDDEAVQRDLALKILVLFGYTVSAVASGEEAVQFIKTQTVDLVLMDMMMEPGMNGLETLQAIFAISPEQKALIASGYSDSEEVRKAKRAGATGFIKKPYTIEQLGREVKKVFAECC